MRPLARPLRGIIVPMVTPLLERNELDTESLEPLVEHLLEGGVSGLFILGTTGEGPSLSRALRREVIERVCRQVNGRVPVLVGVADTSVVESLRLTEFAAGCGASGVVVTASYYYPLPQGEFLSFLERVAPEYSLPILLYNLPSHVGFHIEVETVLAAADIPNVLGLKDSSGDLEYFEAVANAMRGDPTFTLLNGPEQILAETVVLGGHGGICGGANLFPRLYVGLYEAARDGDTGRIAEIQETVTEICDRIYRLREDRCGYLRGLKCALSVAGICGQNLAEPFTALTPGERDRIATALREIEDRLSNGIVGRKGESAAVRSATGAAMPSR